ncbi:MAG: hypothetical protein EAX86_05540 [Candidatus Heimdallarchaeota archaeon]|nr:hypothetical protein [Candidatus Heimdallarchaeota archaeon]
MPIREQFLGLSAPLDGLYQLIHLSANLFSSFEVQKDLCFISLKTPKEVEVSETEKFQLLTYFLDLIQYFSQERVNLIQDPMNNQRLALSGGL